MRNANYHKILQRLFCLKRISLFSIELSNPPADPGEESALTFEIVNAGEYPYVKKSMRPYMDALSMEWFWRTHPYKKIYIVKKGDEILHYGRILSEGEKTREVSLREGEAYIGPCFTVPDKRGMGIYTYALREIIRRLSGSGLKKAYIASEITNKSSISGILKAGFRLDREGFLIRFMLLGFFMGRSK